jgi:hypothetical protein
MLLAAAPAGAVVPIRAALKCGGHGLLVHCWAMPLRCGGRIYI